MRVLIVGGGIGGIATAVALLRVGIEPLVLERAPALSEVGAGILLSANGTKALAELGCAEALRLSGVGVERISFHGLTDGKLIFATQLGSAAAQRYGDYAYHVFRADLLGALAAGLDERYLRLDSTVVAIEEQSGGVTATLANGDVIEGDLLVGADGLRSLVRATLFGAAEARFTGAVAWRAVVPRVQAPHLPIELDNAVYLGAGRSVTIYTMRHGELHNFVGYVPADEVHRESWTASGDVEELRRSFRDACPKVQTFMESIERAFLTSIYFRDPLRQWSTHRITLLGDAAHPAQPTWGQGAAMALEDAVTLAGCLRTERRASPAAALQEYERRRRSRTSRGQLGARINQRFMWESDPTQVRARNGRFRGMQRLDPLGEIPWGWLFRYDAAVEVERPLSDIERELDVGANVLQRPAARRAFELWRTALTREDHAGGWLGQRDGYERFWRQHAPVPAGLKVEPLTCGDTPCLYIEPTGSQTGPRLLHLHGGGFVMGSAQTSIELCARLARAAGGSAVIVDYRLAPEHCYPAAVDDTLAVYEWLLAQGDKHRPIILTAECAGATLALLALLRLKERGTELPQLVYLVSPFCDLTLQSQSIDCHAGRDPWLSRDFLTGLAASFIQHNEPSRPPLAVLAADLHALPPLLIHAAIDEALCDDARRLAAVATKAGVEVRLRLFNDTVHSFVLFGFLPESQQALEEFGQYVMARSGERPT